MTRFWLTIEDGVQFVLDSLERMHGGEIFVPKIPSYRITDVAEAIGPGCEKPIIGIRPGEKIHEEMISSSDSFFTYDLGKYYTIIPQAPIWNLDQYIEENQAIRVPEGFSYNSKDNKDWESVASLRTKISEFVTSDF